MLVLGTFAYTFLSEQMFSIILSVYPGVELLGYMVSLCLTFLYGLLLSWVTLIL